MQILKQDIRDRLLQVAKSHFLKFGYLKASMRSIASDTGIGVGNIYNYYKDKDALFRAVVAPVLCRFEEMLMKHHNPAKPDVTRLVSDDHYYGLVNEYVELINGNRDRLKILFMRSEGSSLENFTDYFCDKTTAVIEKWFDGIRSDNPEMRFIISPMTIHLHTVWEFSLLKEIIAHNVPKKDIPCIVADFIRFEIAGWRHLLKLDYAN